MVENDGPTGRARQKRDTRARIFEAARALFAAHGFEATTVRRIAADAGVATGTVLSHFKSKLGLLTAIMAEANAEQIAIVRRTLPDDAAVLERLLHVLRVYYHHDLRRVPLVAAVVSYSWVWPPATEHWARETYAAKEATLRRILADGVARGEVGGDQDLDLAAGMIRSLYVRNMRRAVFDGADAQGCLRAIRPQIALLLDGLRPHVRDDAGDGVAQGAAPGVGLPRYEDGAADGTASGSPPQTSAT